MWDLIHLSKIGGGGGGGGREKDFKKPLMKKEN